MKDKSLYVICVVLTLAIANACLLYQCFLLKRTASIERAQRQRAEWTIHDGIRNVGRSVSLDSIASGHHFILRYDLSTCLTCIVKAEDLLEEVFGMECLTKELCSIGEDGQVEPSKDILAIQCHERVTPTDDVYTPYFCVISDSGDILFTLLLSPGDYDYNREILTRLKKSLAGT